MITLPESLQFALDSGHTLIVPDRQRAYAARRAHGLFHVSRGESAWASPDVLPFDAWLMRQIEQALDQGAELPRVLSAVEERWLWRMLASQADVALSNSGALGTALRRADRLAFEHGIDVAKWAALGSAETEWFLARQREFHAIERRLGAAPLARVAQEARVTGDARPVVFALDAAISPRAVACHERRLALGWASTWHAPTDRPPRAEALLEAADEREENDQVIEWCRAQLAAGSHRELRIVCIGPGERRVTLASQIGASLEPAARLRYAAQGLATIEGGVPLLRRSRIRASLDALAWLIEGLEFPDFSAWLRAAHSPLTPTDAARLELWWRTHGTQECRAPEDLIALQRAQSAGIGAAGTLAGMATQSLSEIADGRTHAREWSESFRRAVDHLVPSASPGAGSEQHQEIVRWVELLEELGALRDVAGALDAREALAALRELATRASWEPAAGEAPVTLGADSSDPIVHYDAIRICGLDAERWPAPPVADPFIPMAALREAKVPQATAEGQWRLARQHWASWRRSTPDLLLSAALAEGDQMREVSPLLAGVPRVVKAAAGAFGAADATWLPRRWRQGVVLEKLVDASGVGWDSTRPLPAGVHSLQLQNGCAFRAYAELRLGAEALEEWEPGVRADERGRWLHRALELFWARVRDQATLLAIGPTGWAELAHEVARIAIEAGDSTQPARQESIRRERKRLEVLLVKLAELETSRAPFDVIAIESARELVLGSARLQLRIDRIDRFDDDSMAVLDYKSGKVVRAGWFDERPEPTQLFAYLASLGPGVSLIANVFASTPQPKFKGMARDADRAPGVTQAPDWDALTERWTAHVSRIAGEFLEGRAAVDPAPGACLHCHLAAFCRIDEAAIVAAEDTDE